MSRRGDLRKDTDYETRFRCAGGIGILREEVWVNGKNEVVQYNLAFLLPTFPESTKAGYWASIMPMESTSAIPLGEVHPVPFNGYLATAQRFYREAEAIRRSYED